MKNTVIVFARAPKLGAVKRRLARDIGDRAALRFHVATLAALLRSLRRDRSFRTVLAMTPDRDRRDGTIPQGRGDIGQRMHRAFQRFRKGNALLIGCDIPAANAADARAAFKALGRANAVFGPAEDGGYWLVGMGPNRPARPFAKTAGPRNTHWPTRSLISSVGESRPSACCGTSIPPPIFPQAAVSVRGNPPARLGGSSSVKSSGRNGPRRGSSFSSPSGERIM